MMVFDLGQPKNLFAAQTISVEYKFREIPKVLTMLWFFAAFELVLTNRLISITSDERRIFVLVKPEKKKRFSFFLFLGTNIAFSNHVTFGNIASSK